VMFEHLPRRPQGSADTQKLLVLSYLAVRLVSPGRMASSGIGGVGGGGAAGEVGLLFDGALLDIVDDAWRTDTLPNDGACVPPLRMAEREHRRSAATGMGFDRQQPSWKGTRCVRSTRH
jgi:hypothetical protein